MHIERIEPKTPEWNLYFANHIVRYKFVNDLIKNDKKNLEVLDIACGVGYGSRLLSENKNCNITGVDISQKAIEIAQKEFANQNINFLIDDCNDLKNFDNKSFDFIVSFETLEHLKSYDNFIVKMYNLLKEKGTIIISTPNIYVTQHYSKHDWHYHEKEFTPMEFYDLIKKSGFNNIKLYGQNYSQIGILRKDIRHEINVIRSNPFVRLGFWLQTKLKKYNFQYPLPERRRF